MKPPRLGTVWTAKARIQRINGTKWQTLATCTDTPNAIQTALRGLQRKGHALGTLWVVGDVTDRRMAQDL